MQWHYTKQGQQFGPVEEEELRRLARQDEIAPDDLVWNPSLGDKWAPASTIDDLFASTLPVVTASQPAFESRSGGVTHNRDLMSMARESLSGHWGLGVGVMLLYQVIIQGISGFIPFVGPIACLAIAGPMVVGICLVFLSLVRRTPATVGQMFEGFNQFGTALCGYLLMMLYTMLWSLLFLIPGIIAAYAYSMTFFIIADDPSVSASDAITRSKEMMQGNKWKLFCLFWRFFGWSLLCLLTLGIGYLWLGPYMQAAMAHFYEDVKDAPHSAL